MSHSPKDSATSVRRAVAESSTRISRSQAMRLEVFKIRMWVSRELV